MNDKVNIPLPHVTKIILTEGTDKVTLKVTNVCLEVNWYTAFIFGMGRG